MHHHLGTLGFRDRHRMQERPLIQQEHVVVRPSGDPTNVHCVFDDRRPGPLHHFEARSLVRCICRVAENRDPVHVLDASQTGCVRDAMNVDRVPIFD